MRAYDQLADDATIQKTIAALQHNGIAATIVETGAAAKQKVLDLLPPGAEVIHMTSTTLETIGIPEILKSGSYQSVRKLLETMDRATQNSEMQRLGAAPEWAVGSVQAVTEDGHILCASNTGSQLPAYTYGASHVVWVIGAQKIVPDIAAGMRRIFEYCLPLESDRAKIAYGATGSAINKVFTLFRENKPSRITMIIVKEKLGF